MQSNLIDVNLKLIDTLKSLKWGKTSKKDANCSKLYFEGEILFCQNFSIFSKIMKTKIHF